ncbi:TIGR00266 family protein [Salinibacter sp. 10B]|uniref:TIGR00266 family protein n=1 Tax=Salinibacter sp. 10B TaxID=1923971 RepID=UPI000CF369A4|nr:TIGR00266 family protein [Salinibacter sp. 10B]PQJ35556.1 TIGR00266 family protein [Salinibacter sp. 10B]
MDFEIQHHPSYSLLRARLERREEFVAESDAMVSMDPTLDTETTMAGGVLSACLRRLGGESMFVNQFSGLGIVSVAPTSPGQIRHRTLHNDSFMLQAGAYLASSPSVSVQAQWGGLKGIFGGEGAVLLEVSGTGDSFYNAFGKIYEVQVRGEYTCDTSHMVAFDPKLEYTLASSGGLFSTLFSGEGFIFTFRGRGSLFMQTRSLSGLLDHVTPFLPDH